MNQELYRLDNYNHSRIEGDADACALEIRDVLKRSRGFDPARKGADRMLQILQRLTIEEEAATRRFILNV